MLMNFWKLMVVIVFLSVFAKGLEIIGVVEAIYEFRKGFIDGFKDGIKVK